jgi:hypothetical protein
LTGITAQQEMQKNKYQWKGIDDAVVTEPTIPKDKPNNVIALSAQRIRQFYVHFIPLNTNYGMIENQSDLIRKIFATE